MNAKAQKRKVVRKREERHHLLHWICFSPINTALFVKKNPSTHISFALVAVQDEVDRCCHVVYNKMGGVQRVVFLLRRNTALRTRHIRRRMPSQKMQTWCLVDENTPVRTRTECQGPPAELAPRISDLGLSPIPYTASK